MAKEEKPKTFEESVADLEKIVAAIESGQIGLEESLARYEQGMDLVKKCRGIPMREQEDSLRQALAKYQGQQIRRDDLTVLGFAPHS